MLACHSGTRTTETGQTATPTGAERPATNEPPAQAARSDREELSARADASEPRAPEATISPTSSAPPEPRAVLLAPDELPADYLQFAHACAPGTSLTIAAVGDILLHEELQRQAYAAADGHSSLWGGVGDLLARADLTYANLEGPSAPGVTRSGKTRRDPGLVYDNRVYSAYPRFNYHPSLIDNLVQTGVDIVSTANNHALDRHAIGVDKTIAELHRAKLAFTGTRTQRARASAPWHVVTRAKGLSIAWIACAHHTNQIPDEAGQVLYCFRDDAAVKAIKRLRKRGEFDAIIAVPHWGKEYKTSPRKQQVSLAHRMAEAGATAIIGSHPHVLQPWERYTTKDGREVFIHYSLGNFASHQPELPRRSSVLLYLGLTRDEHGQTRVNGVRYMPLHVTQDGEVFRVEAIDRVGGLEDSRALTLAMYRRYNLLPASAPLVTNPHCQPGFTFPPR
jgi:poly-gamma-glutamate synthesis protein (capsule biosynthesis protein)